MRHLSRAAAPAGERERGLIKKEVPMTIARLGFAIGTRDSVKTGTAYRLLSSDGLRVQVVPLAHWILSRLTSP
jgi:hypothetical protein